MEPGSEEDKSFVEVESKLKQLRGIESKLQELVASNESSQEPFVFHVFEGGGLDATETLRIFEGKKMLDVGNAKPGDVFWWTSKTGSRGYFMLDKVDENGALTGALRNVSKDGSVREYSVANFLGGGSSLIKARHFVEDFPAKFSTPPKKDPKTMVGEISEDEFYENYSPREFTTSPVVDMGVIKSDRLSSD